MSAAPASTRTNPGAGTPRTGGLIALAICVGLLLFVIFSANAFNLALFRPSTPNLTLVFAAVSALIFLLLIALLFVLLRNLLKLYAERRIGKLGSQFRWRMVIGALTLSALPSFCLFLFAYQLIGRSMDKWFAFPVEELQANSSEVAAQLSNYALDNANSEAQELAALPATQEAFHTGNFSGLVDEFRKHEKTLQGGFVLALSNGDLAASFDAPQSWPELRENAPALTRIARKPQALMTIGDREYSISSVRTGNSGFIVVAIPLPPKLREIQSRIDASTRNYYQLSLERKELRRTYVGVLALLTVVVLFVSIWLALFLSKLVTRPVEALAEATEEISRGRYDYRVEVAAADELGALVTSFNRMAAELGAARRSMEAASRQLEGANLELEQRRQQMETILESIPTGVLSVDANHRVSRANHALARIFASSGNGKIAAFPLGARLQDVFSEEVAADLESMMRKSERMGSVTSQMEIQTPSGKLLVAVTVSALHHQEQRLGWVIVFDDLSDLLKANKQAAWQEVARRVAHEIKNPLTPISLGAERIQRHLERSPGAPQAASLEVIRECAGSIAAAVETVRSLVDEFSAMARFPTSQPRPADINAIVTGALNSFNGRLSGIAVQTLLAENLPPVMADSASIQRALANIVDNAAEAMQSSLVRELHVSTALVATRDMVEIVVADTGPGVSQEAKEKLFFPYFSTKKRGTGLGLAIVGRIVEEHHGTVRVEENSPLGARFVVELPVAGDTSSETRPA